MRREADAGQTQGPEILLALPEKERALERVRLVSEMGRNIGNSKFPHAPVECLGDAKQATAFLDLVYATFDADELGVIISSSTPGLKARPALAARLNSSVIHVQGVDLQQ